MLNKSNLSLLIVCVLYSALVFGLLQLIYSDGSVFLIRLAQVYALSALTCLYIALLYKPISYSFPTFPWLNIYKSVYTQAITASWYFASLHAFIAFYGLLGGWEGLFFLSDRYVLNTVLGFCALAILTVVSLLSFEMLVKRFRFFRLKVWGQIIYFAGLFIVIHALMLGTHFRTFSELIPQIFFGALALLLILEAIRFDAFLYNKFSTVPKFGTVTIIVVASVLTFYITSVVTPQKESPFSVHSQHIQLAKEAQQGNSTQTAPKLPGMDGDKTKRFTTSFLHENAINPNQKTQLRFKVFDASSGNPVRYYKTLYDKPVHLIIVDASLTYFNHIHPDASEDGFVITTQFPKAGEYHLYLDFQPLGAIEQQMAFTVTVGSQGTVVKATSVSDESFKKAFGDYQVSLQAPKPLLASQLSVGKQLMTFTIQDKSGKPVTTLKPYLAAYGHLVMINQETFEYLHVHPTNITPPAPNANGGPTVEFMPLGLYGPIKPGIYRVFAQFNPDAKLFTADFTVEVK